MQIKSTFLILGAALLAAPAFAQSEVQSSAFSSSSGAPDRAFEIGLGAGYAQGLGDIKSNAPGLTDIAHGGGEITLHLGYRATPNLMVGAYGSGSKYTLGNSTPDNSDVWSATGGLEANWHFLPGDGLDPWVGLGAGWRGHWVSKPSGVDSRHGIDFARLTVGVDYKVSSEFSIAPYIGASGTVFLTQQLSQANAFSNIDSPSANVFIYGGIMGRFDLFGRGGPTVVASN
jgi:outer membrane protein W